MRDLDNVPEEEREEYIRHMTAPITNGDLEDAISLLMRMQRKCPLDSIKYRALQMVIDQTGYLLRGEPSILSRDVIERAIKKHYWD
jgi:hypothetical protein